MEVKLENVSFSYHKKNFIKGADIVCKKGEITTFLGDSTSPIETIFSLVAGAISPTMGEIFWNGKPFGKKGKLKIGYRSKNLDAYLFAQTVNEELSLPLLLYKGDKEEKKKAILESVFLDDSYLDREIASLSKGEKVKVAFASFLLEDNDILLMEDPFFFFSDMDKKDMARLLIHIKKKKIVLFGTSDTTFAQILSDFIYVTSKNKVLSGGIPSMILTDRKLLERARLSMPPILEFMDIVKKEKNIKMMYRSEINDLIKDIYRYVS